jgi:hypothetical protein
MMERPNIHPPKAMQMVSASKAKKTRLASYFLCSISPDRILGAWGLNTKYNMKRGTK